MPYIKQEDRPKKDVVVKALADYGVSANENMVDILFFYCREHIKASYNQYKNFIGELNECAAEIDRRSDFLKYAMKDNFRKQDVGYEDIDNILAIMSDADVIANGDLNYILFKHCKNCMCGDSVGYMADALRDAAKLIRSGLLATYEKLKIEENGDV